MTDADALRTHADRIRSSGVLGRSPLMQRLFDFLLDCSAEGRARRRSKSPSTRSARARNSTCRRTRWSASTSTSSVASSKSSMPARVRASRCGSAFPRASTGSSSKPRRRRSGGETAAEEVPLPPPPRWRKWVMPALAASLAINAIVVAVMLLRSPSPPDEFQQVRESAVWSPLLRISVRCSWLSGTTTSSARRTSPWRFAGSMREFDINSPRELGNAT